MWFCFPFFLPFLRIWVDLHSGHCINYSSYSYYNSATPVSSRMGEIRQWRIKDFQDYLIFYRIQDDRVEVLRVLHGARDLEDILSNLDEEV
ncbi:MAG: type II toxin-antitoxin system RelE/ParE family toxin [Oscillatoriales cyanobacterium]|nr:MAG: type II toxin-antitoxin system RelE/ParE family toxin [Oscillatoriales cyanobacterium]